VPKPVMGGTNITAKRGGMTAKTAKTGNWGKPRQTQ